MFKQETERLKKVLNDLKITTCSNPMVLFCSESENQLVEKYPSEKTDVPKQASSQKSILKQPSSSMKPSEQSGQNLKKSLSISSKTNLIGSDEEIIDDDANSKGKITISTAVYLNEDHTPSCSNITSTYYNKDFMAKSQSEKEVNISKRSTKDVAICTKNNCSAKPQK